MNLQIQRDSDTPLADQVEQGLQAHIGRRVYAPGARLPSIRSLATNLGVSRNTVIEAYDRLVTRGLARSQPGSGYYVEDGAVRQPAAGMANPRDAESVTDELWHLFREQNDTVKLGCGWLPDSWRESEDMAYAIRQTVRRDRSGLFDYGTPLGSPSLRKALSRRLYSMDIEAPVNQFLLTSGRQPGAGPAGAPAAATGGHGPGGDPGLLQPLRAAQVAGHPDDRGAAHAQRAGCGSAGAAAGDASAQALLPQWRFPESDGQHHLGRHRPPHPATGGAA